jgi:hypothetical protein
MRDIQHASSSFQIWWMPQTGSQMRFSYIVYKSFIYSADEIKWKFVYVERENHEN